MGEGGFIGAKCPGDQRECVGGEGEVGRKETMLGSARHHLQGPARGCLKEEAGYGSGPRIYPPTNPMREVGLNDLGPFLLFPQAADRELHRSGIPGLNLLLHDASFICFYLLYSDALFLLGAYLLILLTYSQRFIPFIIIECLFLRLILLLFEK